MNPVQATVGQTFTATPTFFDANGVAISPEDVPVYSSSDPSVASVEPAADGLTALVTAAGEGSATINVSTTNSLGNGATVGATGDVSVAPVPPPPPDDVATASLDFSDPV